MSTFSIRGIQCPVVWASSGSVGVSFDQGIFWYEYLPYLKEAAIRIRQPDVMPTTKSLALYPIVGNELLQGNGETPQRLAPRSMVVDFRTATTLNAFGHSGFGLVNHLIRHTWRSLDRQWVLSLVSDKLTRSERVSEYHEMCQRLLDYPFNVRPLIEPVFGCPNVRLSLDEMFADCPHVIENMRKDLGDDWRVIANISPIAKRQTFAEAVKAGADCLRLCNSVPHWFIPEEGCAGLPDNIPWRKKSPLEKRGFSPGGYSGPMCAPIILERLSQIRDLVDVPIGFGNGFYSEELIAEGFKRGGNFLSLGMAKLLRFWKLGQLIDCANDCAWNGGN